MISFKFGTLADKVAIFLCSFQSTLQQPALLSINHTHTQRVSSERKTIVVLEGTEIDCCHSVCTAGWHHL